MPPLHALFGRVRIKLEINKGSALESLKAGIAPGKDRKCFFSASRTHSRTVGIYTTI
jgi:hypothetical protein